MKTPTARHAAPQRKTSIPAVAGISAGIVLAALIPAGLAHAAPDTVASDTFTRTSDTGWGNASKGGAWTTSVRSGATASVTDGQGVIADLAKSTSAAATLTTVSSLDTDVIGTIGLPQQAATLYSAFEIRRQADGSSYRGRLELSSSGRVTLAISRLNKSSETNLGRFVLPGTATPGAKYTTEFQVLGTSTVTIAGRAWVAGATRPDWQLTTTDSSSSKIDKAGAVGLWEFAGGSNATAVTTTLDDVTVTKDPTSAATPAPSPTSSATTSPTPAPSQSAAPAPSPSPTATTTPVAPVGTKTPDRGSVAVGGAKYAVPAGAIMVAPSGNDGAAGTTAAPLRTVAAAIAKATSGSTIVLRAGTYNESVTVPRGKSLTIQSYPGEAVWFDGSQAVTSWSAEGSTWSTPWSYFPSSAVDGVNDNPRFVSAAKPYASRPDQVFFDGKQLTQVGSASAVTPGTFYPDAASGRVIVGSNPSGHAVRISNLPQAIKVNATDTTLRGFGVKNYATSYLDRGAVRLSNTGETAENLVIQDNAMIGINVENNAAHLSHLTVTGSGLLGVGANASYGFEMSDSVVTGNNSQAFKVAPVAGGFKITRSRGVLVSNVDTSNNTGTGIWLDESVYDAKIVNSTSNGNTSDGISAELSDHVTIANNDLSNNLEAGAVIYNTANVQIVNNDIGGNKVFGIKLAQDERRQANTSLTGHDARRPLPDPTLTWVVKNIDIENNAFGSGGAFQIYALDGVTHIPADAMDITVNGNMFNQRLTTSQATLVAWGGSDNHTITRYDTVTSLAAAKGSSWKNAETLGVLPITSMLSTLLSSVGIAVPLPADIAALVGEPTGTKHVGTF